MFSAIIHKKAGRWFENNDCTDFDWSQSIRRLEDSLTAFLFDTLATTRGTTISKLLTKASGDDEIVYDWLCEETFTLEYWPSLKYDNKRVEPDVVIMDSIQKQCLIIEAKWGCLQTVCQVMKEIGALSSRYPDYKLTAVLLGGDNDKTVLYKLRQKIGHRVIVSGISWQSIPNSIKSIMNLNLLPAEKRSLRHLQRGLLWYGIRKFEGFGIPPQIVPYINERPSFFRTFRPLKNAIIHKQQYTFSDLYELLPSKCNLPTWRSK